METGASSIPLSTIEKLEGAKNYGTWAFAMKMYLIETDLWQFITDAKHLKLTEDFKKYDQKTRAKICLSVNPAVFPIVESCKTAAETWAKLEKTYKKSGSVKQPQPQTSTSSRITAPPEFDDIDSESDSDEDEALAKLWENHPVSEAVNQLGRWTRGDPLVERYTSDEEIPALLREEISRANAERDKRERQRKVVDVKEELNEDVNDIEEKFFGSQRFDWRPMNDGWRGRRETFSSETPGPTQPVTTAYEAFRSYWDNDIISHIVTETNRYAQNIQRKRFQDNWYETNSDEILLLFCFWMMLGVIQMPTIKSCFSHLPMLRTHVFRSLFTEPRYWNLNAALHFASASSNGDDPTAAVRPVVDHINRKCMELYNLHQNVCIDESLVLWKGPLSFKQYIKTKAARFGIKTYQLCESTTGYLWSFTLYSGRGNKKKSHLMATVSTVLELIRPILNKGHTLFMDNFFNSPILARYLKQNGTDCVGTLRGSRKHVPLSVQKCPLNEGEFIARHADDVMVMALYEKKRTLCISTYHDISQIQIESRPGFSSKYRLQLVEDYNHGMGGVDLMDQMLQPYLIERKQCMKWSKKFFKRILNFTIQNARILLEQSSNSKIDALSFRLALVSEMMQQHLSHCPKNRLPRRVNNSADIARLTERHFIRRIPVTEEMRAKVRHRTNLGRRKCYLCSRKGKDTRTVYECPDCEVALCLADCFEKYHTVP